MNEAIRVSLISLGCARNLVDSEVLLGHAVVEGFLIAEDPADADVVVINTCGFIEAAKQESIDAILSACELKKSGRAKAVLAVGCLSQRYGEELQHQVPELDAVLGLSDYSGIPAVIRRIINGSGKRYVATVDGGKPKAARSDLGRVLLTPKSYSYLRISEGCDHKCSFCAIPGMRGRNRSKPLEVLVEEAQSLASQGVKELVVVAEDSTAYGLDLYRQRRLHALLEALSAVQGIEWIRLMYAYPHTVDPMLTEVLRENPKLLPYLDIPIQHINGGMLRAMKRGVSAKQVKGILTRLREEVPGIALRSTLIVGFPGETQAAFTELRDFVAEFRFERMGAFCFSSEEGTPAHELDDQVPTELAEERRAELMQLQQEIIFARNKSLVGTEMQILVDGRSEDRGFVGRSYADAPEVDCLVHLDQEDLHSGDLIRRRITGVDGYDLHVGGQEQERSSVPAILLN